MLLTNGGQKTVVQIIIPNNDKLDLGELKEGMVHLKIPVGNKVGKIIIDAELSMTDFFSILENIPFSRCRRIWQNPFYCQTWRSYWYYVRKNEKTVEKPNVIILDDNPLSMVCYLDEMENGCVLCHKKGHFQTYYYPNSETSESIKIILCAGHYGSYQSHGIKRLDDLMAQRRVLTNSSKPITTGKP
jgi:hypothetical protein